MRTRALRVIDENKALRWCADTLVTLRPAWWVTRAWIIATILFAIAGQGAHLIPRTFAGWTVLVALVLASAGLGKSKRQPKSRLWWVAAIVNVVAIVAFLPVIAANTNVRFQSVDYAAYYPEEAISSGMWADGRQVTNLFIYGPDGAPVANTVGSNAVPGSVPPGDAPAPSASPDAPADPDSSADPAAPAGAADPASPARSAEPAQPAAESKGS